MVQLLVEHIYYHTTNPEMRFFRYSLLEWSRTDGDRGEWTVKRNGIVMNEV